MSDEKRANRGMTIDGLKEQIETSYLYTTVSRSEGAEDTVSITTEIRQTVKRRESKQLLDEAIRTVAARTDLLLYRTWKRRRPGKTNTIYTLDTIRNMV